MIALVAVSSAPAVCAESPQVISDDIERFWSAYDRIAAITDRAQQKQTLEREYLLRGTSGLEAFVAKRKCTADRYLDAINRYPRFWASIRPHTLAIKADLPAIDAHLHKFRSIYPQIKPARLYAVIGCLTSVGTAEGDKVLIGAEIATGDPDVDLSELPPDLRARLSTYFATHPAKNLTLLSMHEYVHTQQVAGYPEHLLGQVLAEGAADFVAELITGQLPPLEYMRYGPAHSDEIKHKFAQDMDKDSYRDWLYNGTDNAFGVADLGYYVGYAICAAYYRRATDKGRALRDILRLNYLDAAAAHAFMDASGFMPQNDRDSTAP
ncbi:DUF2268 domain-containing putative Zn-dependent protease [Lysobacter sp. CA199]|uniref:DUF2268 domain-containing putative Zn-dependent protease n=1 Tax=Lysobacter sp. CA199 TaxID=3455608 RepID=UPI003F8D710B